MASRFRTSFRVVDKKLVQWFPGHMTRGMRQMQQQLKNVDCVIEVHDSRIPFSGRNTDFKHTVTGIKPHILVMNKKDLADDKYFAKTAEKIRQEEGIEHVIFTNCKDHQCSGTKKIVPLARNLIAESDRFNRTETPEFCLMVVGVPNVGKSSLINTLRNRHLKMKGAAAVGGVAGITRSVNTRIKINVRPLMYLLDTPGVLLPRINDHIQGLKLASTSCMQDHLVGPVLIADYLLFWMNQSENFEYVFHMGLTEPTDKIEDVLLAGCKKLNRYIKIKRPDDGSWMMRPNFDFVARHMIEAFRTGVYGPICMDHDLFNEEGGSEQRQSP